MHQELARARLVVAELAGRRVCGDMDTVEKGLAVLVDTGVAVAQVDAMRTQ